LWDEYDKQENSGSISHTIKQVCDIEKLYIKNCDDRMNCAVCSCPLIFDDDGLPNCSNTKCGVIHHDVLDFSPEWRYYGSEDNQSGDPSRIGLPINNYLEESAYSCKLTCSSNSSYEMRKIKRYSDWTAMPYKEKSQYEQFQKIRVMATNAGLPMSIINDAIYYHKKITEYEQTFRGDNKDGLIAASVYISCRVNNYPRTAKELATIFHLDNTSATQGCKTAQIIINYLEKDDRTEDKTIFANITPVSFIDRYCSKLNISSELTQLCKFISKIIDNKRLLDSNAPNSIASGVVYYVAQVCGLHISKQDVKSISDISEVTINKCYKKLLSYDNNLFLPGPIKKKYSIQ
jgi:transcription initiation factor TFIIB